MIFYLLILVVALLLWKIMTQPPSEGFKVLGALGGYQPLYNRCLSECERIDPGKKLDSTHGSFMCQEYCDSELTKLSREKGPFVHISEKDPIDLAYEKCGYGRGGERCRSLYFTDHEIDKKCRQNCEYSTLPSHQCMESCTLSLRGNRSMGWTWK